MKAMLFVREQGAAKFIQENGLFEDIFADSGNLAQSGESAAYSKGEQMAKEGNIEAFQVWTLEGEYARTTTIEVIKNA